MERLAGLLILFVAIAAHAITIVQNGVSYDCDERYSFKDFGGQNLTARDDMTNRTICRSSFSNETPDAVDVFPPDMTGTTFLQCNLDNVLIPNIEKNTVVDGSVRRFKTQNDGMPWIVDPQTLAPVEPLDEDSFQQLGLSTDPAKIPKSALVDVKGEPINILTLRQQDIKADVAAAVAVTEMTAKDAAIAKEMPTPKLEVAPGPVEEVIP